MTAHPQEEEKDCDCVNKTVMQSKTSLDQKLFPCFPSTDEELWERGPESLKKSFSFCPTNQNVLSLRYFTINH